MLWRADIRLRLLKAEGHRTLAHVHSAKARMHLRRAEAAMRRSRDSLSAIVRPLR